MQPLLAFGPQLTAPGAAQTQVSGDGSVSGVVTDDDGAVLANAEVTLSAAANGYKASVLTGPDGRFRFEHVPAGGFSVTASSAGLVPETAAGIAKPAGNVALATIVLPVATTTAEVDVVESQHDLAQTEIKTEEQQRLFGVLPNFYVSYNWHAAPLDAKQKSELALKTTIDPVNLAIIALTAGIQQATNSLPGYGQGAAGYGARLGANMANFTSGTLIGGLFLPILFHQDPRFFYRGTGTIYARAGWALAQAFISRTDKGKWRPAYAGIGGDLASGAISNLYYPRSSRNGVSLTIENGLLDVGEDALGNLVQEFFFKKFTPHSANYPPASPPGAGSTSN
jgi:hypothetical protein